MRAMDPGRPAVDIPADTPPPYELEVEDLAVGEGDEAFEAGVSEEQALSTVLPWLSAERTMELAAEAVELYCWDRLGSDN